MIIEVFFIMPMRVDSPKIVQDRVFRSYEDALLLYEELVDKFGFGVYGICRGHLEILDVVKC